MIKLIVGLGNPGQQYQHTRHNAGAWYVRALADAYATSLKSESKLFASIGDIHCDGHKCILAIPNTFMNLSGKAVQALMSYYKIEAQEMLIAHDEIDLDTGIIRFKQAGGHGGHNGLRDIMQLTGSKNFWRLRIGVGHPGCKDKVSSYVLNRADSDSEISIMRGIDQVLSYTDKIVQSDFDYVMNHTH